MEMSYTLNTGSLREFLQKVKSKELGVPDKVTQKYLESIGYKAKNDRRTIHVLKSIGFLETNGVPKQDFRDFRTEKSEQVMASAVRKTYANLFKIYPNPLEKSKKDLENYFANIHPKAQKRTLTYYVNTFKVLCEFADFKAVPPKDKGKEDKEKGRGYQIPESIPINLNIQITLPVTDDAKVYENIFKALREQLYTRD